MTNTCINPGCNNEATKLCPICQRFEVQSWFCSQECLQAVWKEHKKVHKILSESVSTKVNQVNDDAFDGFKFTGNLRPFAKAPRARVPNSIWKPDYADTGIPHSETKAANRIMKVLSESEILAMRRTGKFGREILDLAISVAKEGVTTEFIDNLVFESCMARKCYPSPLNYYGFPKSCCTSINEVICHGIPDSRPLQDGDILNIDITTYFEGYHGDLNETIFIGKPSDENIRLVKCAYDCLANSMDIIYPGVRYSHIGVPIDSRATKDNFSVVRTYCGHGVNSLFHSLPNVPHYKNNKAPGEIKIGHSFTIEPMINAGVHSDKTWPDKWTAVTTDGKNSAQFEHTMIVTKKDDNRSCSKNFMNGPQIEVVTKRLNQEILPKEIEEKLSAVDKRHFEMYGRPHFIDQLVEYDLIDKMYTNVS